MVPASPGILVYGENRSVAVNADGVNSPGNGAVAGSVIGVYLTGIGSLGNAVATGATASHATRFPAGGVE